MVKVMEKRVVFSKRFGTFLVLLVVGRKQNVLSEQSCFHVMY